MDCGCVAFMHIKKKEHKKYVKPLKKFFVNSDDIICYSIGFENERGKIKTESPEM